VKQASPVRGYQGSYWIGFILLGVVALRTILFYQGGSNLTWVILLLAAYGVYYALEPWLTNRFRWHRFMYYPLQTGLVLLLTNLRPFTDISNLLYVPLCVRALHIFSRRTAIAWIMLYAVLLSTTLMLGMAWLEGLAVFFLYLAVCGYLISYDLLYDRTQADQAEGQILLANLQEAHRKLQAYVAQAEELAAARERNRLARELHDSVSQVIFSITLTSQTARLLLERDPTRVPEQLERLQEMTGTALSQLRSLITQLRPQSEN
jgi:signal transduction histidine kinase